MLNSLTYNGTKSTDLGIFVTGSGSFDAAEMDAEKYEIPGRNGDLILSKNRYKNITVTYPAFVPRSFKTDVQNIRNWMRSTKTYARLEDTYDMAHYRLGLASGIQSFEPANRNDASNFQLSFDCRPERFLKTGETPLPVEPEAHSYSGEVVSFETVAVDDITKAEVSLSPIQSLNGYDFPWAGGAGKNLLDFPDRTIEYQGLTYTLNEAAGTITLSGVRSTSADGFTAIQSWWTLKAGTYTLSGDLGRTDVLFGVRNSSGSIREGNGSFTLSADTQVRCYIQFHTALDASTPIVFRPQLERGSTATDYAPYENICPISGHTGATLKIGTEYPTADREYPVTFPQTVYGGTYDFVSGKLKVTHVKYVLTGDDFGTTKEGNLYRCNLININFGSGINYKEGLCNKYAFRTSYANVNNNNGSIAFNSSQGSQIIIRDDACADGNALKAAATAEPIEVVYPLATAQEYTLTPAQVQTLLGTNNVWASDGSVVIEYADPFNVENPTYYASRPLFEITNPAQDDVLTVNGQNITFLDNYTGTVVIDCETMNCYSGLTNLNYLISATDFPVLNEGVNIVTWSGAGACTMTPRWWEL